VWSGWCGCGCERCGWQNWFALITSFTEDAAEEVCARIEMSVSGAMMVRETAPPMEPARNNERLQTGVAGARSLPVL